MVRISTVAIVTVLLVLILGGGAVAYYFKSKEDSAETRKAVLVMRRKIEMEKEAQAKAEASRAEVQNAKTDFEKAQERIEILKLQAATTKFSTDIEKTKAETELIKATRDLEAATARLQKAESDDSIAQEELLKARDDAEAARVAEESAKETARIAAQGLQDAADIVGESIRMQEALDLQTADVRATGEQDAESLRSTADQESSAAFADINTQAAGINKQTSDIQSGIMSANEAAEARIAQEAQSAQREAQQMAQELATLREGCQNVTWNNVFVDGRVGRDISFAGQGNFNTQGQTITKDNVKITFGGGKTIVSRREMTGRDSRGNPIMSWRPKAEYDGMIVLKDDRVGYIPMTKKPMDTQPNLCRQGRTNYCQYDNGDFTEIYDFNDANKEYLLMAHKSYLGVMQGDTGKFYSIPDKKVIDNPYRSDCQTKLDYK